MVSFGKEGNFQFHLQFGQRTFYFRQLSVVVKRNNYVISVDNIVAKITYGDCLIVYTLLQKG